MVKLSALLRLLPTLCLLGFLCACASDKDKELPDKPVEELYTEATDLMEKHDFKEAAKHFEEVERQHPYSQWATRAELMAGFALYQALDYDGAIAALDSFIHTHPGNDNVAYAYYLRALCDYERLADVRRDQSYARNALKELETIVSRFPTTPYAKDAVLKIALVKDHLAGAEMEIGRNYMNQKLYTAAVGRFRAVVDTYQTTSHVPEALHRLVECYLALGIMNEAKSTAAVLGHNFPGSTWYENSYSLLVKNNLAPENDKEGWLARTWKSVF